MSRTRRQHIGQRTQRKRRRALARAAWESCLWAHKKFSQRVIWSNKTDIAYDGRYFSLVERP